MRIVMPDAPDFLYIPLIILIIIFLSFFLTSCTFTYEDEDETYLVAIDISDVPFVKKHIVSPDKVYIAFPGNTGRTERNAAFVEYLLNWSE